MPPKPKIHPVKQTACQLFFSSFLTFFRSDPQKFMEERRFGSSEGPKGCLTTPKRQCIADLKPKRQNTSGLGAGRDLWALNVGLTTENQLTMMYPV
jgi:hypothetical protein